jgi:hypothetical protein|tara:strand:- start:151 stop:264 length:114 start_codon:yes stop_codon:yes gene_type:complete
MTTALNDLLVSLEESTTGAELLEFIDAYVEGSVNEVE